MTAVKVSFIFIIFAMTSSAYAKYWNRYNSPYIIDRSFENVYANLPLQGEIANKRLAWPANHWANHESGIAYRWTATHSHNFSYKSPSLNKLKEMEAWEIDELSPAEKYSILIGDYSYRLVGQIWRRTSPHEAKWNGICHGVAPASAHYEEPEMKTVTNREGINIKFYSSDIKGLLSYFYANVLRSNARLVGTRCNNLGGEYNNPNSACGDVNPGAFHIIMANKLGIHKEPFISDIDQYMEVWNHVATKFESYEVDETEPAVNSALGTVKRIRVQSSVTYASAIRRNKGAILGTDEAYYLDNSYDYYLDIDSYGRIVGGEWIGKLRPDFVWVQPKARFFGSWRSLNKLLN